MFDYKVKTVNVHQPPPLEFTHILVYNSGFERKIELIDNNGVWVKWIDDTGMHGSDPIYSVVLKELDKNVSR